MAGGRSSLVLLLISVYILMASSSSGVGVGEGKVVRCVERERRALLTFKQGLVDDDNLLSSWGAHQGKDDCCQWRGIGCSNRTGRVIKIDLNGYSLSDDTFFLWPLRGKISPSLLELQHLNYLDLSYTDFGGRHIPHFIGSLTKLTYLNLYGAYLSGEIPYQIQNLSNLRYLDLSYNDLNVRKLEWVSRLPSLRSLDMSKVNLSNVTDWLEAITSAPYLKELHLRGCGLSDAIPSSLPLVNSSASLSILDIGGNSFTSSIFHWLFNVSSSLVDIDLSFNFDLNVKKLQWLSGLPSLRSLDMSRVNLSNATDWLDAITNAPSLAELHLSGCGLSDAIPSSLPLVNSSASLSILDLGYNSFTSSIFHWLFNVSSSLVDIDLSSNHDLNVKKLEWLSGLPSLRSLDMSYVNLSNATDWLEAITSAPSLKELNLEGCGLSDAIPSSLPLVNSSASLSILDLRGNHLTSSNWLFNVSSSLVDIDLTGNDGLKVKKLESLSRLPSLRSLHMNYVNLSKVTDWLEAITNAPSLSELHLWGCGLSDAIPSSLPLVNSSNTLAVLDLPYNYFTSSIFQWLFNVSSNLVEVVLNENQIRGHIPEAFQSMTSLARLDLSFNQLEGTIPKSFGNLCNLQSLELANNNISGQLSEIVHHLSNCSSLTLEVLYLYNNSISGSVPDLTVFSSLRELYLFHNQLKGTVSPGIGNLTQLQTLDLSFNSLEGIIYEAHFQHLSKLQILRCSFNSLFLNLSSDWSPPFQLDSLYLDSCKLGPQFPGWLRNQKKLRSLSIRRAGISEAIPNWLCDLTSIVDLDLSDNEIRGRLPNLSSCFGNDPKINLSSNHLEGHIPQFPSTLAIIDLSKNMFSGPISFLCASGRLRYIDLSDNLLSGELPECWMHLQYLSILDLANNNLSGKIPISVGSLVNIMGLHLQNNSFTGELPSSLKNCSELSTIDLGNNRLSGTIPAWIGESLSNLVVLSIRFNAFYGSIPLEICRLAYIQIFDLSFNNISGTIPNCLNNFTAMTQTTSVESTIIDYYNYTSENGLYSSFEYYENARLVWKGNERVYSTTLGLVRVINLSSNKLMGEIPNEIMDLVGLIGLNLSRNCLTGVIDEKIGQLRKLDFLDLSRNKLFGRIPSSLSQLSYIGVLDLSYNNLSGKIPSGTQLQSFGEAPYVGNLALCGLPLTVECPRHGRDNVSTEDNQDEDEDMLITHGFILSMGLGFAVGFWGVCGTLLLNTSCRFAYFKLLDNIKDWLYVTITVNKIKLQRWWLQR